MYGAMDAYRPTASRQRLHAPLVRIAGMLLVADGAVRMAGGRGPTGVVSRPTALLLGGVEMGLGLALLQQAPVEPETLYAVAAPVYDALAPLWRDWLYRDPLRAFDAAIAEALPPGADVLDLGCGTGAVLQRLLALDRRLGSYTGVDLSAAMLARARAKFGRLTYARFAQVDLRVDPLPDGPFDRIVSAWALEHLPEPRRLVEAARARLRPGGRLVLFFELDGAGPRAWAMRTVWRFFAARLIHEDEARAWPGLVSLRRFRGLGPDVALAVIAAPAEPTATRRPA